MYKSNDDNYVGDFLYKNIKIIFKLLKLIITLKYVLNNKFAI